MLTILAMIFSMVSCTGFRPSPVEAINQLLERKIVTREFWEEEDVSPNGEWVVKNFVTPIQIISVNSGKIYEAESEGEFGICQTLISWSPDSSKFAVFSAPQLTERGWDRLIIYHQTEESLKGYVFLFPDLFGVNLLAWSPDSQRIITSAGNWIYILDEHAQVIKEKHFEDVVIINALWNENGIYMSISEKLQEFIGNQIWFFKNGNLDNKVVIDLADGERYALEEISPDGKQILVYHQNITNEGYYTLYDFAGQKDVKRYDPENKPYAYLFDWTKEDFVFYDGIDLLGYYPKMGGYLAFEDGQKQHLKLLKDLNDYLVTIPSP